MINYVVGDEKMRERIRRLEVGQGVESDYHPMIVTAEGESQERRKEGGREEESGEE